MRRILILFSVITVLIGCRQSNSDLNNITDDTTADGAKTTLFHFMYRVNGANIEQGKCGKGSEIDEASCFGDEDNEVHFMSYKGKFKPALEQTIQDEIDAVNLEKGKWSNIADLAEKKFKDLAEKEARFNERVKNAVQQFDIVTHEKKRWVARVASAEKSIKAGEANGFSDDEMAKYRANLLVYKAQLERIGEAVDKFEDRTKATWPADKAKAYQEALAKFSEATDKTTKLLGRYVALQDRKKILKDLFKKLELRNISYNMGSINSQKYENERPLVVKFASIFKAHGKKK